MIQLINIKLLPDLGNINRQILAKAL